MAKNSYGFTLSEVILASSLSVLIFVAIGFMWYFLTRNMSTRGRLEELRQEAIMIMDTIDKDLGYRAIGSRNHPGLVVCSTCPAGCFDGRALFGLKVDTDNNVKNGGEQWEFYYFDSSTHRLTKGTSYPGALVSDKVCSIDVSPYPSGTCDDYFMVKVHLVCRYFPDRPVSKENPQITLDFIGVAHQISVR